jgi:hypothetical protein
MRLFNRLLRRNRPLPESTFNIICGQCKLDQEYRPWLGDDGRTYVTCQRCGHFIWVVNA